MPFIEFDMDIPNGCWEGLNKGCCPNDDGMELAVAFSPHAIRHARMHTGCRRSEEVGKRRVLSRGLHCRDDVGDDAATRASSSPSPITRIRGSCRTCGSAAGPCR